MERVLLILADNSSLCLAFILLAINLAVFYHRRKRLEGIDARKNKAFLKYGLFIVVSLIMLWCARWVHLPLIKGVWAYVMGISFLSLPVADWYLTRLALGRGAVEANPAMSYLISKIGIDRAIGVIMPLAAAASAVTLAVSTSYFFTLVIIYGFIIVNNIIVLKKAACSTS
jgi:hypothetical protein